MHSNQEIKCKPLEIPEADNEVMNNLLSTKWMGKYETTYGKFLNLIESKSVKNYSENCIKMNDLVNNFNRLEFRDL